MGKTEDIAQVEKMEHNEETIQGLVDQLYSMREDRDRKCAAAKEQLIESLKVTADKYRTATGVMEALRVIRMVNDGTSKDMEIFDEISQARVLATGMVDEVGNLVRKAESLGWAEMDQLCKGAYNEDFISESCSALDLCIELMRLDLCRNVGPAAEDMVSFIDRIKEELDGIVSKLNEMDGDWRTKYQPQDAGDRD